jgi:hypothetical protein
MIRWAHASPRKKSNNLKIDDSKIDEHLNFLHLSTRNVKKISIVIDYIKPRKISKKKRVKSKKRSFDEFFK